MKSVIGLLLAFSLGAVCRFFDIPVPSPPKLLGALLVVATTMGYMAADQLLEKRRDSASTGAPAVTEVRLSAAEAHPVPTAR